MFTTPSAVPPATIVRPSFQMLNTSNTLVSTSTTTNPSWCSTTPSVVSIINGNSPALYIATQPSSSSSTNLLRQSSQTVRLVSPGITLINNSNTIITGQVPMISSTNNHHHQSGICIDTSILGRLATSTNQEQVK